MRTSRTRRLAPFAAGTAVALAISLASPVQASASGITTPSSVDLQGIVNCLISVVDQLLLGGRPDPDDCAAVPGGV